MKKKPLFDGCQKKVEYEVLAQIGETGVVKSAVATRARQSPAFAASLRQAVAAMDDRKTLHLASVQCLVCRATGWWWHDEVRQEHDVMTDAEFQEALDELEKLGRDAAHQFFTDCKDCDNYGFIQKLRMGQ